MIITKNATYLHIPKTGGTWVRHVLRPIALEEHNHELLTDNSKPACVFVRNPWAWYAGSYNSMMYGSEDDPADPVDPFIIAFGRRPTFEEFIETQVSPTPEFKRKLLLALKLNKDSSNISPTICEHWIESDKGWYQLMCDLFTEGVKFVGTTEDIRSHLATFMHTVGDLTPEVQHSISTMPMKNMGKVQSDYRGMYSKDLAQAVNASSSKLIQRMGYMF